MIINFDSFIGRKCLSPQNRRNAGKIFGPLLDRINTHFEVPAVKFIMLRGKDVPDGSFERSDKLSLDGWKLLGLRLEYLRSKQNRYLRYEICYCIRKRQSEI